MDVELRSCTVVVQSHRKRCILPPGDVLGPEKSSSGGDMEEGGICIQDFACRGRKTIDTWKRVYS